MKLTLKSLSAALLITVAGSAFADSVTASTPFNAIVFGDFSAKYSDTEGSIAVGGNTTLTGYSVNSVSGSPVGVYAGGSVTLTNGQINGSVISNGAVNLTSATATGGIQPNTSNLFSTWHDYFTSLSTSLGSKYSTGNVTKTSWGALTLTGHTPTDNVFWLSASDFQGVNTLNLSGLAAGSSLLLNIVGNLSLSNLELSSNLGAYNTLLNFVTATDIFFEGTSPHAAILAPNATLRGSNGHIEGSVVVNNWNSDLELHLGKAIGTPVTPPVSVVPEPTTLALASLALMAIFYRARNRKSAFVKIRE